MAHHRKICLMHRFISYYTKRKSYSCLRTKNKYCFSLQNFEQDSGDMGVMTRLSSPRDSKFSSRKHPKNLKFDIFATKK